SVTPTSGVNDGSVAVDVRPGALATGTHQASVTVSASGSPSHTVAVTLTLTAATAPPALSVDRALVSFRMGQGAADPGDQTFAVSNAGGGTLRWNVSEDASWLTVRPAAGTNDGMVTVSVSGAGLPAGTHTAVVTVTGDGTPSRTVAVTLEVASPSGGGGTGGGEPVPQEPSAASLEVSTRDLTFSATLDGQTAPRTFTIQTGDPTVSWSLSSAQSWITTTPRTGRGPATVTVQLALQGGTAGTFEGAIQVTAASGTANSPQTVNVHLNVLPEGGGEPLPPPSGSPGEGDPEAFERANVDAESPGSGSRVDAYDVVAVIRAVETGDLSYDVTGDGKVDSADVDAVLARFGEVQ
ncbi:MAG: hypothetical protein H0V09_04580, partial [Gemmatimonadetes bacterium]|nr:hypothetical protein [Gemmatimonadota bacterium]